MEDTTISGLFSKPKMPEPKPVVPMPDPEGPEADAARRRQMEKVRQRSGRASTILSGEPYSNSTLGTP